MAEFIDFLVVVLPTVIALLSVFVSIKLTKNEPHKIWWGITIAFGIAASALTWVSQSNTRKAHEAENKKHEAEIQKQNDDMDKLRSDLRESEVQRKLDSAYLRAKLEDTAEARAQYKAIMRLAQISEENTRRQYEQKVLSNKDLREFIADLGKKMRDWESRNSQAQEQLALKYSSMTRQILILGRDKGQTPQSPEIERQLSEVRNQEILEMTQLRVNFDNDFKQNILGDAVYARQQLITRLGEKQQPNMNLQQSGVLLVFQGMLFGPYPISTAATYLELFARKLVP